MTLKEAKEYINYGIKEGIYESEQFEKMTDQQLINFSEKESARADAYAEDPESTG